MQTKEVLEKTNDLQHRERIFWASRKKCYFKSERQQINISHSWSLINKGVRGTDPLNSWKSVYNIIVSLLYPQIQSTVDGIVLQHIFIENNPHVSGPMQSKPVLFKDQRYIQLVRNSNSNELPFKFVQSCFQPFICTATQNSKCT